MTTFTIGPNEANYTLYRFLRKAFRTTPLAVIEKWFRHKEIAVNGVRTNNKKTLLQEGDVIVLYDYNQPKMREAFKSIKNPHLDIVYEDQHILIVNKPANLEIHSPMNISLDDLVKSYLVEKGEYHPQQELTFVVTHLYRLDKLTSGMVVYAKNKPALDALQEAQLNGNIRKYYVARTEHWTQNFEANGWYHYDSNQQRAFYYRDERRNLPLKTATTKFQLLEQKGHDFYIQAQLGTGRKHQIRATLDAYKMPIVNDFRYGGHKINKEKRIYLKAFKLKFDQLNPPLHYLSRRTFKIGWDDLKS